MKRDLRITDNKLLSVCEEQPIPYQIIYIFEPKIIKSDYHSLRHLQFIYHSIIDINKTLKRHNHYIKCYYGEALDIFEEYNSLYDIKNIYAYQESGTLHSFRRDRKVRKYSLNNKINFIEYEKDSVQRGISNRRGWDKKWFFKMSQRIKVVNFKKNIYQSHIKKYSIPKPFLNKLVKYPDTFLKPGYKNAIKLMKTFLKERSQNYNKNISKPYLSRKSCSRISPYLSWGNISSREVYQFFKEHKKIKGINSFITRLKWRSHFIQKLETEYEISYLCANRDFENMKYSNNKDYIKKWKNGTTGIPLVDANMRCLKETGWINFRMRAMLVSVLSHHLDCDWKLGVKHLAKLFLDYEPGIHFSQFQMQSGTTGINTVRMYNPIKQSYDHDENGLFIKKWIPELKDVPIEYLHEPWNTPPLLNSLSNDSIYRDPCIDIVSAGKKARTKIWKFKSRKEVKLENKRILRLHTRNGVS